LFGHRRWETSSRPARIVAAVLTAGRFVLPSVSVRRHILAASLL